MTAIILGFWLFIMFMGFCAVLAICYPKQARTVTKHPTAYTLGMMQPPWHRAQMAAYGRETNRIAIHYYDDQCHLCNRPIGRIIEADHDPRINTYRLNGSHFRTCTKCAVKILKELDRIEHNKTPKATYRAQYVSGPFDTGHYDKYSKTYELSKTYSRSGIDPMCGQEWLDNHLERFPDGRLPDQTLEVTYDDVLVGVFYPHSKRGTIKAAMKIADDIIPRLRDIPDIRDIYNLAQECQSLDRLQHSLPHDWFALLQKWHETVHDTTEVLV